MKRVLLVIDMQNGFCHADGSLYCGPQVDELFPFVERKIDELNEGHEPVFFTGDNHQEGDPEFTIFARHCVTGTWETEIAGNLFERAVRRRFFPKKRYSAFFGTDLEAALAEERPDLVEVTGVCTNICVLYTVEELRNRWYEVLVHRRGVTSFDLDAHEWALRQMQVVLAARVE